MLTIENISKNFTIHLPSYNNKKRIVCFSTIEDIEEYIEQKTGFKNILHIMNIPVYYKNFYIGKLTSNKDKVWAYHFKISKINLKNLKLIYSFKYEEDSYIDEQILPEYKIYKINFIENEILVTTYEYEDYGSYDFLVIDNEILNDLERLKEYVEHLLFS